MGQQELYLSRQVETPTADTVQEEIKKLEEFFKKMDTHDEKINHVRQFADQLQQNGHYAGDKRMRLFLSIFECFLAAGFQTIPLQCSFARVFVVKVWSISLVPSLYRPFYGP